MAGSNHRVHQALQVKDGYIVFSNLTLLAVVCDPFLGIESVDAVGFEWRATYDCE